MKYTFKRLQAQYPNDDTCLDVIMECKFATNPTYPSCIVGAKFHKIIGCRAYACLWCKDGYVATGERGIQSCLVLRHRDQSVWGMPLGRLSDNATFSTAYRLASGSR